ncbi:MAG: carboxypeptidase regulatory-like domain-containing protein [Candidatus Saganbacteria bacterium]|nr:carboxypeptidase regulatory-like domain-containing protein [Candidatus Saganbacteria bacterium]
MLKNNKLFYIAGLIFLGWLVILVSSVFLLETPQGSISGRVVVRHEKTPLAGVTIIASGPTKKRVVSGADGTYKLSGLAAGKYNIKISSRGYGSDWLSNILVVEGADSPRVDAGLYLRDAYFNLYSYNNVYSSKEKVVVSLSGQSIDNVQFSLYEVDPLPGNLSSINKNPIKKWKKILRSGEQGWFSKDIHVSHNKRGVYKLVSEAETFFGKKIKDEFNFSISDLGIVTKQSPGQLLVYAVDFITNQPVPSAPVKVYKKGNLLAQGKTDKDGLFLLKISDGVDEDYLIFCTTGLSSAFHNTRLHLRKEEDKAYIYTDRPIYRPDQEVFFKGIIRAELDSGFRVYRDRPVSVEIKDASDALIYKKDLLANNYGSFNDKLALGEEPPLGTYSIIATVNNKKHFGKFMVEEYRKPEYKVEVKTSKQNFINGETINVSARANYYFGSPVANAEVKYTVYSSNYYPDGDYYWGGGYGRYITQGKVQTDQKGEANFQIKTEKEANDKKYHIEVSVTDPSRKPVIADASVIVSRGEFHVNLRPDKYVYSPGDQVTLKLSSMDYKNQPLPAEIEIILEKEEGWEDSQYKYSKLLSKKIKTNNAGQASLSFSVTGEGYYMIKAHAKDRFGNTIDNKRFLWVCSGDYYGASSRYKAIEIVSDKKDYKKGDTAVLLINSPTRDAYALITVEGPKVYQHEVVQIKGYSKRYSLKIKDQYLPNVYLKVAIISGKNVFFGEKNIAVSAKENFLNVSIDTEKEKYYPGDTVTYRIKTTDSKGRGVPAEISLGVVDASIYAIQEELVPKITSFFYGNRKNRVATRYSFPDEYSGGKSKLESQGVRKNFKDTAAWFPSVLTDLDGNASLQTKLPDNLTAWRATARAHTLDTKVGSKTQKIITRKDLIVRLEVPRFFGQKDRLTVSAVVHNYTEKNQPVSVSIEATGGIDIVGLADSSKTIQISKDGSARLDWLVHVKDPGEAQITVSARGEGPKAYDAMELTLPIMPHGIKRHLFQNGSVKDLENATSVMKLPENAIRKTIDMKVRISPSAVSVILGALDYLLGYPYGCVEQTMSKLLPDVVVSQALKELRISNPKVEKEVPKMVKRGLQRLYNYQHSDGGWGWWENDPTDPYMTAYAFYGLQQTKKAGFSVRPEVLKNGALALKNLLISKENNIGKENISFDEISYMLYSLSFYNKETNQKLADAAYLARQTINPYSKALLAIALHNIGLQKKAAVLISELSGSAIKTKTGYYWKAKTRPYSWMDNEIETTAYVLKAFILIRPKDPVVDQAYQYLLSKKRGNRWTSTKDTAAAVYALADYTRLVTLNDVPDYTAKVYLNNQPVGQFAVVMSNLFEKERELSIDPNSLVVGDNEIRIEKEGSGKLFYSVSLKYFGQENNIKAENKGLSVRREYFRVKPESDHRGNLSFKEIPLRGSLNPGDQIKVKLTVKADSPLEYILVEDPLPSGCEIISEKKQDYWYHSYSHRDNRDEKVAFFINSLYSKEMEISYNLRAEIPGTFSVMPALAYGMYSPEVFGNSYENTIRIKE